MSQRYTGVQWTRQKLVYDAFLLAGIAVYLAAFILSNQWIADPASVPTWPILMMRATGTCAFLMLTLILCLGPLARLDRRFLVLMHNRRHFGVLFTGMAFWHAKEVLGHYQAFGSVPALEALFRYDASFQANAVPFQMFGLAALVLFSVMALTSHDFWQKALGPTFWKWLHMGAYLGYGLLVAHVAFGALQTDRDLFLSGLVAASVISVSALHLLTAWRGRTEDSAQPLRTEGGALWIDGGPADALALETPTALLGPKGERIVLLKTAAGISALHGVCAHQGGPLAEGKVLDGCLTCPWHGWQYQPANGEAPPPFEERLPTYRVQLGADGHVLVHPEPCAGGQAPPPLVLNNAEAS